jgi:hypothetical protein
MGKVFFNVVATFAEFEGDLITLWTREGRAIVKQKERLHGKQPKQSDKPQKKLHPIYGAGQCSISDLAECFFNLTTNSLSKAFPGERN